MVFVGLLVRRLGVLTQCNLVALANAVGVSNPTSRAYSQEFFKVEKVASARKVGTRQKKLGSTFEKKFRQRLSDYLKAMASPEVEQHLAPLRASVKEYGDLVRALKENGAPKVDIDRAIIELKARKKRLEERELELAPKEAAFDRLKLEDLLRRRFFYDQSFAIYGGVTGLYDFGPMGCAMKANMIDLWRKHFILEEGMLEVDCSVLTPEPVLKASGHVDRFADWMVKDVKTGECFRADHLIKNHAEKLIQDKKTNAADREALVDVLARLEGFNDKDMQQVIKKFHFKSPITGNELTDPIAFNLMFPTVIGPTGDLKAFLRPETAQGIFVNFKRLLEFNQGKLPFAAAQIGSGFRNEISPRQGLIRVREFTMCEIEHFVDPNDKNHPKFAKVRDYELTLFSACNQMDGRPAEVCTIGRAVDQHTVANETLGYYMVRVHQFLVKVGVDPRRLRFRQHLANEMAHYACDCWDAEILTSYGWIECVGNADRACFDLQQHYKATNVKLTAEKKLPEPKTVQITEVVPNKGLIGKAFKANAKQVMSRLAELSPKEVEALEQEFESAGKAILAYEGGEAELGADMMSVKRYEKKVHVEEITPSVIEPSFGVGRIMYAVLEHSFRQREGDEQRTFLTLPPQIAPIKCSVLPISANVKLEPILAAVREVLAKHEISFKQDDSSGSIGRRYARTDEIGIPFGVTVDFESEKQPWTVTLRYALTMEQVRLQVSELGKTVHDLATGRMSWEEAQATFPKFEQKGDA
uniref:Glycine--tRNA ligase n=1 Tax=Ascaris suum TaxID=6253 RepID=F1KWG7_ASCSU